MGGGNNFFPPSYSKKTGFLYIPSLSSCNESTFDPEAMKKWGREYEKGWAPHI